MKSKIFLFIFILIIVAFIYTEGERDPYSPFENYHQLKIINKTNNEIEFYNRNFYSPIVIKPNEYYLTQQIRESYIESCFFIIKYSDNTSTIYDYNKTDHWIPMLQSYHIAVFEDGIRVFEAPVNQEYDYNDLSIYHEYYTTSLWTVWNYIDEDKTINLINECDYPINIYIYDAYSSRKDYILQPGEKSSFAENQTLFQLRPIELHKNSTNGNHEFFKILIYHKWFEYNSINVVFRNKSYELIYD